LKGAKAKGRERRGGCRGDATCEEEE